VSPDVRKALLESAAKWGRLSTQQHRINESQFGRDKCTLCDLFFPCTPDLRMAASHPSACDGCPVSEATGMRFCVRSPYEEFEDEFSYGGPHSLYQTRLRRLAWKERNFLLALVEC
jgi:hypothetical protein